jgi:hypothetical protein
MERGIFRKVVLDCSTAASRTGGAAQPIPERLLPSSAKGDEIKRQGADGRGFVSLINERGTQDFHTGNGE